MVGWQFQTEYPPSYWGEAGPQTLTTMVIDYYTGSPVKGKVCGTLGRTFHVIEINNLKK